MILPSLDSLQAFLESQLNKGYALCQPRGIRYVQGQTVAIRYYRCTREGDSKAYSGRKRHICKLGAHTCDAGFTARYTVDANKQPHGSVVLLNVKLEHQHPPTFLGQPVPHTVRMHIESQLQSGVDPLHIASRLQQSALDRRNRAMPSVDRVSFLSRSYFKAYSRLLVSREIELDKNDHKSVAISVQERWQDSVLSYHPLGLDGDGVPPSIFYIVIASKFQRSLLKRHGTSVDMVFFDGTHGVVKYRNFYLFTILVIDDDSHGFPVAWMLSNSKDMQVQTRFLQILLDAVPEFQPGAFMVDEDPAARGAVERVFSTAYVYFCDFHLWRAWKTRLDRLGLNITSEMERHLLILRRNVYEEQFDASLEALRKHFKESADGQKFWEYLLHNYLHKKRYWAGYLRHFPHATNNHLESWHNHLKSNHLKRKSKMRIDQ